MNKSKRSERSGRNKVYIREIASVAEATVSERIKGPCVSKIHPMGTAGSAAQVIWVSIRPTAICVSLPPEQRIPLFQAFTVNRHGMDVSVSRARPVAKKLSPAISCCETAREGGMRPNSC
jgi:hypothetical protein